MRSTFKILHDFSSDRREPGWFLSLIHKDTEEQRRTEIRISNSIYSIHYSVL